MIIIYQAANKIGVAIFETERPELRLSHCMHQTDNSLFVTGQQYCEHSRLPAGLTVAPTIQSAPDVAITADNSLKERE